MFEPPLPYAREFRFEPSRYDVHGNTTVRVVVNTGDLFGCDSRVPRTGQQRGNDIEFLGVVQESL